MNSVVSVVISVVVIIASICALNTDVYLLLAKNAATDDCNFSELS